MKNKFFIISDDCWSLGIYNKFNMKYNSPFVNLFIHTPCYIKLLNNLDDYLNSELIFIEESKYKQPFKNIKPYVIGKLKDIEIHFSHYKSGTYPTTDIKNKWERRLKRLTTNKDNIIFKIGCWYHDNKQVYSKDYDSYIKEFHNMKYKNKISFTIKKYNYKNNFVMSSEHIGNVTKAGMEVDQYCDFLKTINKV